MKVGLLLCGTVLAALSFNALGAGEFKLTRAGSALKHLGKKRSVTKTRFFPDHL